MNTTRKLRLTAAAIVSNGMLILSATSSVPAFADACSSNNYFAGCGCLASTQCKPVTGCTATKICGAGLAVCGSYLSDLCIYN